MLRSKKILNVLSVAVIGLVIGLMIVAIITLILFLIPSPSVDAQQWSNPRCQPVCEPEPPEIKTETRVVFYPVYIREEIEKEEEVECANHFIELGICVHANEVGDTGFPNHNFLKASIDLRSKRFQNFLDIAGGISFGYVQNQGAIGANLKLGVPFASPGPSFDIIRVSWMVNNSISLNFKQVGLRIPLLKVGRFSYIPALGYVGVEAFAFYSEPTGYTDGYTFILGAAAEVCKESFSFGCFVEFHACQQKWECSSYRGTVSLEVGVQLWLF